MSRATRLEALDVELIDALASSPRRLRGARANSPELEAARELASKDALEAARALLDARDASAQENFEQNAARLNELGKLITKARKEQVGLDCDSFTFKRLASDLANYRNEQGVLFGMSIDPWRDLAATGRFIRSLRYHDRQVGMLNQGFDDILSEAIILCYLDPQSLTTVTLKLAKADAKAIELTLPTIGGLYRACKRAYGLERNRLRKANKGLIRMYSLDELKASGTETGESFDWYGYDYGDSASEKLTALLTVADVAESRDSLDRASQRIIREQDEADRAMRARMDAATLSGEADRVTRVACKMLAVGDTIANVARKLGIAQTTLVANLKAADWRPTGDAMVSVIGNVEAVPARPQRNGIERGRNGAVTVRGA